MHILLGAGTGAGADETFCLEPVSELESSKTEGEFRKT